ncbi:Spliceosome-associated protein 49 [Cryptotrichosporon argae]
MQNKAEQDRNQDATVYLGNLDEKATDALVWELMLQAGPVSNIFLPKDRISMTHQGFGFCEFLSEVDADYACKILNQIKLYGKPIRVSKASYDKKQLDVGANLFIGSVAESVEEGTLYDTFSRFGTIAEQPKIARDPTTGAHKGYAFLSFHDFDAADQAIENMNGQFLGGKQITVQYAFKKDGKGERHGTAAERLLANQAKKQALLPGAGGGFGGGQFAGALAAPPPPAGIPVYNAPAAAPAAPAYPPQPPFGQPQYPQQGYPQAYPPQGYPAPPAGFTQAQYPGYPQGPPGPPAGFQQGPPGQNGFYPPPPAGFTNAQYPQQGFPGGTAAPPPIRMGFNG